MAFNQTIGFRICSDLVRDFKITVHRTLASVGCCYHRIATYLYRVLSEITKKKKEKKKAYFSPAPQSSSRSSLSLEAWIWKLCSRWLAVCCPPNPIPTYSTCGKGRKQKILQSRYKNRFFLNVKKKKKSVTIPYMVKGAISLSMQGRDFYFGPLNPTY